MRWSNLTFSERRAKKEQQTAQASGRIIDSASSSAAERKIRPTGIMDASRPHGQRPPLEGKEIRHLHRTHSTPAHVHYPVRSDEG